MTNSYVILTGSKNNAGDFLIKHRAKKLFAELRPDRDIIDMDGWKPFNDQSLEIVNSAKALILMGGPALQPHMHPSIYPLTPDLNDIRVPITTMGIGWKSARGSWNDSSNYPLQAGTKNLLHKITQSPLPCSVRDFHTLNVLNSHGLDNTLMTGCPAYYDLDFIGSTPAVPKKINKVAFSLGVSFISSNSMEKAMKSQILELKDFFSSSEFEVVFHHSLDPETFLQTHGSSRKHVESHNEFAAWLSQNDIDYVDISGSAENLVDYYSKVDIHIGYRVHAHIFMNSISKLSLLIAEDGRGKAAEKVIGGLIFSADNGFRNSLPSKIINRLSSRYSQHIPAKNLAHDLTRSINYEMNSDGHRMKISRLSIDQNFEIMKRYIKALP
jgi:hypothetical protein